jgi:phosphoenolpyruvate synthase/pyruvate phosphate dikinase
LDPTIATLADGLKFGTNDLSSFVYGWDRDGDPQALRDYLAAGLLPGDFTAELDGPVASLMATCIRNARTAKPGIRVSICGRQAASASAARFGAEHQVTPSVPPFQIPVALLASAQANTRN